ncbi:nuclease-related domain-containing protein [Lysinibacillus sp. NPDC097287]|uniref:nuclease-related domain-containing protein n=1 Tax=Lysinibacillus sp. NPDC097287 TaxID=3364144 RepID=UPI003804078C
MIVKPFSPSPFTLGLEALLARLHPAHPQFPKFEQELKRQQAGDFGEQYIMNELQTLSTDFQLFHNVILPSVFAVQIDILIVTPNGIIILEIKNIKGTVLLKNNPRQLVRTTETGEVTVFTHPEIQLEQYIQGMKHFLQQHNITIPIYGAIVFPFNNVQIQREGEGLPILMAKDLPMYIHTLPLCTESTSIQNITSKIMKNIKTKTPYPLCRYYNIDINSIQMGIRCEKCLHYSMTRQKRTWHCANCQHTCVRAHIQALRDYYMLIGNTITNKQCRQLLNIENTHLAKRILQASCKVRGGSTKNRIYTLPELP